MSSFGYAVLRVPFNGSTDSNDAVRQVYPLLPMMTSWDINFCMTVVVMKKPRKSSVLSCALCLVDLHDDCMGL